MEFIMSRVMFIRIQANNRNVEPFNVAVGKLNAIRAMRDPATGSEIAINLPPNDEFSLELLMIKDKTNARDDDQEWGFDGMSALSGGSSAYM
jgi:hypothetical protein